MTKQEIFDTVVARLRDGYGQSINGSRCTYRDTNGVGCAVGCLLTDAEYGLKMEGIAVSSIPLPSRLKGHVNILFALQHAHDKKEYWDGKEYNNKGEVYLQRVAHNFSLTYIKP